MDDRGCLLSAKYSTLLALLLLVTVECNLVRLRRDRARVVFETPKSLWTINKLPRLLLWTNVPEAEELY